MLSPPDRMALPIDLPDALESADDVKGMVGEHPAFFLDYDGTLTPIVSRPEDAELTDAVRAMLSGLASRFPVAVVSGRGTIDVAGRVGLSNVIYAGSHGNEIDFPDGSRFEHPKAQESVQVLDRIEAELTTALLRIPGVLVERKPFAIAVHTRGVDQLGDRDLTEAVVHRLVDRVNSLVVRRGKEILEIRPGTEWDKGTTVAHLLQLVAGDAVPVFIGDDDTDEDGFREVNRLKGVSIVVGQGSGEFTAARFRLDDPPAVVRFLSLF